MGGGRTGWGRTLPCLPGSDCAPTGTLDPGADGAGRGTHLAQRPWWGSPEGRGRGHWVPRCRSPRAPPAAQLLNAFSAASAPPGALVLGRPARAPQSAARALRPAPGEGLVPGSHEGGNPPAPPPAGPPARSVRKNGLELRAWDSVTPSRTPGLGTRRLLCGERRELTSPLFLGQEQGPRMLAKAGALHQNLGKGADIERRDLGWPGHTLLPFGIKPSKHLTSWEDPGKKSFLSALESV